MARAPATFTANSQGYASSQYPDAPPLTTGALRYIGNPVHDAEITIISDGSIDFGVDGSFLINAVKLDTATAGYLDITPDTVEHGQQVLSTAYLGATKLMLQSAAGLPYGIGVAAGVEADNSFGTMETLMRDTYPVVFKHETAVFLAANQANCISGASVGGQIKGDWHYFGPTGYTAGHDDVDVYTGVFNAGPTSFGDPAFAASNYGFIGSVVYPVSGEHADILVTPTSYRDTLTIRQSTITFSQTNGSAHMRYINVVDGTLANYHKNVNLEADIIYPEPDRCHFLGNAQGIYHHLNQTYHLGERIILAGTCRLEIADSAVPQTDWEAVTGLTKKVAVAIPVSWSRKIIKQRIREQVFAGESLNGKYFHVYTTGTTSSPAGVFVGSILIDGEHLS